MILVIGFTSEPLRRFAHPPLYFGAGLMLGLGAWGLYRRHIGGKLWSLYFGVPTGLLGVAAMTFVIDRAVWDSQQTDRYCSILQQQIVQATEPNPAAERAFDLFKCRPQFDQRHPLVQDINSLFNF